MFSRRSWLTGPYRGTRRERGRCGVMSFTQLNPTLPVTVEGKGKGYAFAVIDYGQEHHLIWVVALDGTRVSAPGLSSIN